MEWLRKLLKAQGVEDTAIEVIVKEAEKESLVPKHRFDEVNEAKKEAERQLKERDTQLTELKKNVGDNEALKQQIEALQGENKAQAEQYQKQLREVAVTSALKAALAGQVHDEDLLVTLLDTAKIELDESGKVKAGLEDQVKALRESKAFLFVQKGEESKPPIRGITPVDGHQQTHPSSGATGLNLRSAIESHLAKPN